MSLRKLFITTPKEDHNLKITPRDIINAGAELTARSIEVALNPELQKKPLKDPERKRLNADKPSKIVEVVNVGLDSIGVKLQNSSCSLFIQQNTLEKKNGGIMSMQDMIQHTVLEVAIGESFKDAAENLIKEGIEKQNAGVLTKEDEAFIKKQAAHDALGGILHKRFLSPIKGSLLWNALDSAGEFDQSLNLEREFDRAATTTKHVPKRR